MRIAIASGKGGTGKTTVATNLVRVLSGTHPVQYVDCDVEEPNGHLFLHPQITRSQPAGILVPMLDLDRCTRCGACSQLCQYHAIANLGATMLVFPELCHGCGGCIRVCPEQAIREEERPIGVVEHGTAQSITFLQGRLNVGETMSPPLIRAVLNAVDPTTTAIIDAPPGTSCPVLTAVRGADFVLLVTEPTAFGLHDLMLAVEMVRALKLPTGIVINRADMGDDRVERYCATECLPILERWPHDRRVAEAYARGMLAVEAIPDMATSIQALANAIFQELAS